MRILRSTAMLVLSISIATGCEPKDRKSGYIDPELGPITSAYITNETHYYLRIPGGMNGGIEPHSKAIISRYSKECKTNDAQVFTTYDLANPSAPTGIDPVVKLSKDPWCGGDVSFVYDLDKAARLGVTIPTTKP
jgi:hypothetical protein